MSEYCQVCNLVVERHDPNRMSVHIRVFHKYCLLEHLRKTMEVDDARARYASEVPVRRTR